MRLKEDISASPPEKAPIALNPLVPACLGLADAQA